MKHFAFLPRCNILSRSNTMAWRLVLFSALAFSIQVRAKLPHLSDCQPLEDRVLGDADPKAVFGTNSELARKASPVRVGNLRHHGPIPTHHFASNMLKSLDWTGTMRLFPYEATMDREGVSWDAYTMDRWSDPARTDLMEQQSAWETGKAWVKLNDMGTNFKQMVSAPDGNPFGVFDGKSGVRVGFQGSGEPVLKEFGDLYANFLFTGSGGASMEVPVVRGATLSTHIFKNANPVIKPYCLSKIAGQAVNFDCPVAPSAADAGTAVLDGHCQGSTLTILVHSSKAFGDWSNMQWAASASGQWSQNHGMHTCDAAHCSLTDNGHTMKITVPQAHGEMSFAVNHIGHYVMPNDWTKSPMKARCSGRRRRGAADVSLSASCSSSRSLIMKLDLADLPIDGVDKVQYAVDTTSHWHDGFVPSMHNCDASKCKRHGNVVTITLHAPSSNYEVAVNIVGYTTIPMHDWIASPLKGSCDGSTVKVGGSGSGSSGTQAPNTHHTDPPTNTHQSYDLSSNTKFVMELNEPGKALPGQTRNFVLYFSEPVKAQVVGSSSEVRFQPVNGGHYNGIVQLGYLGSGRRGDNSHNNYLDKYKGIYPYKPSVSSCVSDSRAKAYLSFDWNPVDAHGHLASKDLLIVAMPHQELLLRKTSSGHLADSVYGFQTFQGNSWLLEYDVLHTSVAPSADAVHKIKSNSAQLKDIHDAIARDVSHAVNMDVACKWDSYGAGKAIGFMARLASISRAFGTNDYQHLDSAIEKCLNKWLRVDDSLDEMWKLRYDVVWGGLFLRATKDPEVGFGADFGFPYYNDHHFHLGYFLYAAAYYVSHHRDWGNAHKDRLYLLARDVGNPSHRDPFFPVVRHQDFYNGFSWASGVTPGDRQEESSSEGINCYHALAALGEAFGDPVLKHAGQLHLAMEITSVREYWQVRSHNKNHFPPMLQKTGVAGMISEGAWYLYTLNWPCDPNRFPMRHACLVGIQVIPITAVSRYWVDKEWAGSVRDVCERAINPSKDKDYSRHDPSDHDFRTLNSGWQAFCYAAMAHVDSSHQSSAAAYLRHQSPATLVSGTGAASTLVFIYGST